MKAGLVTLAAVALLQLATAQPHGLQEKRHRHHRRQAVVEQVDYLVEEVIVYVDDNGNAVSTTTVLENAPAPTVTSSSSSSSSSARSTAPVPTTISTTSSAAPSTPTTMATSTSTSAPPPPPPSSTAAPSPAPSSIAPSPSSAPPASSAPAPVASSSAPAPAPSAPASPGLGFGKGLSYSPYNKDNSCKGPEAVATDLAGVKGFDVVRLYGVDCNQIANVVAAKTGMKLFIGIFDINSIESEVQTITSAIKGDWSLVQTVSVGNELVNSGGASVGEVVAAIGTARTLLKAAGYTGPVVTVDTMVAMQANPELCTASDFCAINCHAFFDSNTQASGAGAFVQGWIEKVSQAANGKLTIVTESGWPAQGQPNGAAVPSPQNQQAALSSIQSTISSNVILYSAFNTLWKTNSAATFGAEQYWGMFGNPPSGDVNTS
ncbi:hypothetical protein MMC34_000724 [Xylographa carneopallida]|nr:hypothetical protein [Xylographa carneopallida]